MTLQFESRYLVAEVPGGVYRVEYQSGEWSALFSQRPPAGSWAEQIGRPSIHTIDRRDAHGTCDWETREAAIAACKQHAALVAGGMLADAAADKVGRDLWEEELKERAAEESAGEVCDG